jgi:hypothetical protein
LLRQVAPDGSFDSSHESSSGAVDPTGRFRPPEVEELQSAFPRIEILELVGRGGMSAVYKAKQIGADRVVALKVLPKEVAQIAGGTDRFAREARTLGRLNHPNIVTLYDAGQAGPWCYLVMEYIDGPSLRQLLGNSRLPSEDVVKLIPDLCDGLQYAHDQGVVHRDVKPENVLLDRHGRATIADFGLARLLRANGPQDTLTATRQVAGTPYYIAPEALERPDEVDHRADVFSLGVLIYEMLTGELPAGHFDPPSRIAGSHVRLDGIVLRALAKEPSSRYQEARELRRDVLLLASEPPLPTGENKQNWGRFHELFLSGISIALLLGGIVSAVESQGHFTFARGRAVDPGVEYEEAWLYLGLTCALWVLSASLSRVNVSQSDRWCDLSIAQWLVAPILLAGYLLLGFALSLLPAVWICALAAVPVLVNVDGWEMFGQLFGDAERSFVLTRYWVLSFATAAFSSAGWTAIVAYAFWQRPGVCRRLFHPASEDAAKSIAVYMAVLVLVVLLPMAGGLLYVLRFVG